jgi:hypothetical protein
MDLQQIKIILSSKIMTISEQPISLGELLMLTLVLVAGVIIT